eukprot:12470247-Ditylum_brightwellii.AAC.1
MERLSPHKATQQFIEMYVMGHDDTYEGGQDGRDESTLIKHLTSECVGGIKGFQKFMVGVNPTQ